MTVVAAGVDSWSPAWRVTRESWAGAMLDELATVKSARGSLIPGNLGARLEGDGPAADRTRALLASYRVGWVRGADMLYAEGHPARDGELCSPDDLPAAYGELCSALCAAGVPVPPGDQMHDIYGGRADGFVGVRRVDATVDLAFSSGSAGVAALAGVAAIAATGLGHAELRYGRDGGVETVYFRGRAGKKVLGRWYDKGLEAGTARRGMLIRPEDQRRYVKGTRRGVDELSSSYVRGQFQRRFVPLYKASRGVTVGGPLVVAEKLAAAIEAGEITALKGESLAGFLLLQAVSRGRRVYVRSEAEAAEAGGRDYNSIARATTYRRKADALALGLVLADGVLEEVEVNLHDVLEECLDSDAWGAQG